MVREERQLEEAHFRNLPTEPASILQTSSACTGCQSLTRHGGPHQPIPMPRPGTPFTRGQTVLTTTQRSPPGLGWMAGSLTLLSGDAILSLKSRAHHPGRQSLWTSPQTPPRASVTVDITADTTPGPQHSEESTSRLQPKYPRRGPGVSPGARCHRKYPRRGPGAFPGARCHRKYPRRGPGTSPGARCHRKYPAERAWSLPRCPVPQEVPAERAWSLPSSHLTPLQNWRSSRQELDAPQLPSLVSGTSHLERLWFTLSTSPSWGWPSSTSPGNSLAPPIWPPFRLSPPPSHRHFILPASRGLHPLPRCPDTVGVQYFSGD
ncbi:PREDICTED: LOW QUALITY PROTEIN: uncharacterized protein DKFZp434B061 [Mandrillus leucophaeus]|uniref:LOW QUALITY PROTEIN: uncharacterized protein DKFZp434B061 n=1 Tax=Mandrillus leucophaeus TaxID=9568 RepID=UPI0005F44132|nr:PREDICTED: LOW QUALITY PROTEIN: uncharacterized protein DKFZp434B061 [Mandrillus leucophaeus]